MSGRGFCLGILGIGVCIFNSVTFCTVEQNTYDMESHLSEDSKLRPCCSTWGIAQTASLWLVLVDLDDLPELICSDTPNNSQSEGLM